MGVEPQCIANAEPQCIAAGNVEPQCIAAVRQMQSIKKIWVSVFLYC